MKRLLVLFFVAGCFSCGSANDIAPALGIGAKAEEDVICESIELSNPYSQICNPPKCCYLGECMEPNREIRDGQICYEGEMRCYGCQDVTGVCRVFGETCSDDTTCKQMADNYTDKCGSEP